MSIKFQGELHGGGGAHPYSFREFRDFNWNMLLNAKVAGHLFARKFAVTYPEEMILEFMNQ